jgi:hypothetical protein
VCVALLPYFCVSFVIIIVRARGSKLWRFLANGRKTIRKKAAPACLPACLQAGGSRMQQCMYMGTLSLSLS